MQAWILYVLMLLPLATAAAIALRPGREAKGIALLGSLITVVPGWFALFEFDWSNAAAFQGAYRLAWIDQLGLTASVGVDSVALLLIALTVLLGPIVVLCSFSSIGSDPASKPRTYYAWIMILQAAMTGVFASRDLIFFYVCFEFTLVPMYVLISLYGSSNRKRAATKFFLYTFTGSLLTLAGLVYVVWFNATKMPVGAWVGSGTWTFDMASLQRAAIEMSRVEQMWVMLAMLAGFAVKVPLFPVHTWLPLAHTEAPTAGSVILAGVLLKLGTYGLYRFVLPYTPAAVWEAAPALAVLSIIGILYAGLICWVQTDVKKLVAYSSVAHLGFCVLGLVALNNAGLTGSVLYMINHGLSTGALFLLIGMAYERYHTRDMRSLGGLASKMPVWSSFMVFFVMASVGLPGLNGFVSEFLCLMGTFQSSDSLDAAMAGGTPGRLGPAYAVAAGLGVIIAAMYLLIMVGNICFGPLKEPKGHHAHETLPTDLNAREITLLMPLAILCLGLGLFPKPMMKAVEAPVNQTVEWVLTHKDRPLENLRMPTLEQLREARDAEQRRGALGDGEVER